MVWWWCWRRLDARGGLFNRVRLRIWIDTTLMVLLLLLVLMLWMLLVLLVLLLVLWMLGRMLLVRVVRVPSWCATT